MKNTKNSKNCGKEHKLQHQSKCLKPNYFYECQKIATEREKMLKLALEIAKSTKLVEDNVYYIRLKIEFESPYMN